MNAYLLFFYVEGIAKQKYQSKNKIYFAPVDSFGGVHSKQLKNLLWLSPLYEMISNASF
jgi:hypothetical protein